MLFTDTLGDINGVCRFIQNIAQTAHDTGRDLTVFTSTRMQMPPVHERIDNVVNFEPIYARRMLIRTMKLVGATNGFIRRPFLVEGMAQGIVAGIIACLLVWPLYDLFLEAVPQAHGWPGGSPLITLGVVFLAGLALGWLGSWLAVRRFIKHVSLS